MSSYSYLVRKDNKTMYELGKNLGWSECLSCFKVEKNENLLPEDDYAEETDITLYNFSVDEMLFHILRELFDLNLDDEYINYIKEGILKFCDGNEVYLLNDGYETYTHLKHELGFVLTASRYLIKDKKYKFICTRNNIEVEIIVSSQSSTDAFNKMKLFLKEKESLFYYAGEFVEND